MGEERSVFCVVTPAAGRELTAALADFYATDPRIAVVVDRRSAGDRRVRGERRAQRRFVRRPPPGTPENRRITNPAGRRIAERRRPPLEVAGMPVPSSLELPAGTVRFLEAPALDLPALDAETDRLITRVQSREPGAIDRLYALWFDRVHAFCAIVLPADEVEEAVQEMLVRAFAMFPQYEFGAGPFRCRLAALASPMFVPRVPARAWERALETRVQAAGERIVIPRALEDEVLVAGLRTLPSPQREVLALRYVLGLTTSETGRVLERDAATVATVHEQGLHAIAQRSAGAITGGRRAPRLAATMRHRPGAVLVARRLALAV